MSISDQNVGFIGLGLMGAAMVQNLLNANLSLNIFNRTRAKCNCAEKQGAYVASSAKEVAEKTGPGIIILCVSDTSSLLAAMVDEKGVLAGLSPGTLVIDMGTSEVGVTKQLAELVAKAGGQFLDAPVSGGEVGAKQATLSIMAGGEVNDLQRATPLLNLLGQSITHIGPVGTGQAAKAANQAIVGATVTIVSESLLLAQAAGADISKVREALLGGFAASRVLDLHGQRMIDDSFDPGARATTQLKDLKQSAYLADALKLDLPLLAKCRDLWTDMIKKGFGNLDQSGYFHYTRSTKLPSVDK